MLSPPSRASASVSQCAVLSPGDAGVGPRLCVWAEQGWATLPHRREENDWMQTNVAKRRAKASITVDKSALLGAGVRRGSAPGQCYVIRGFLARRITDMPEF